MNIDNGINIDNSNWKFNKEVVDVFDSHVRKSVPMYDDFHKTIIDISEWFVEEGSNIYDIGTSRGEALRNIAKHHKSKQLNCIGIDESKDMIDKAREDSDGIMFINADVTSNDVSLNNASFITSILTMQFISQRKRKNLIKKIYDGLNDGGGFILVEKVIGNNARFDEMFIELYHDFKLEKGLSTEEVFAKSRAIRGAMKPNTNKENINILEEVGFKDVDIFFKWCNFVGYVCIK